MGFDRGGRIRSVWCIVMAAAAVISVTQAQAIDLDLFNPFKAREPAATPSRDRLPYVLSVNVVGGDQGLPALLRDASSLHRLRAEPPVDAEALVRRAQADLPQLIDTLWGAGHYNARVAVEVAGIPLRLEEQRGEAAVRAAEAYRARAVVPVRVLVDPGPVFALRSLQIIDAKSGAPLSPSLLPARTIALAPGDPARSDTILAAQARIIDHIRALSRPFAKVARVEPVVIHPQARVDLTLAVDPGPVVALGQAEIRGLETIDPGVIRSFIYTKPGDPYSPEALASVRRSVGQIEAVSSIRVSTPDEPQSLNADGNLPLFVDVTERSPRAVGLSARYSSQDGPAVQGYWTHRNLFGGAERLRLEASAFYLASSAPGQKKGGSPFDDLGGRITASFVKPALGGTPNDLLFDATLLRERTEGYVSHLASATAGIRHRFGERFSAQAGIELERGSARDALSEIDYTLVGLPIAVAYDSTDRPLDPTRGMRITGGVTPYSGALSSSVSMTVSRGSAAGYLAVDEGARVILAGRIGLGSIFGADLEDIPANRRLFAGGGGSVRGFGYKSLGPRFLGEPIGGRSLLEASFEARIKVTETIGIVPFIDLGSAFETSFPDFSEPIYVAGGLGLRYYTSFGPIRLDVATPLTREKGQGAVAVYLGFGQAF
jgi:translocation and assembly module TamA